MKRMKRLIAMVVCALAMVTMNSPTGKAAPTLPPGNTVEQWNTIAENTVVGSGASQAEGFIYMAYVSAAVYDAAVSIEGGYEPYGSPISAASGASTDAAIVEAAYRTLVNYFPSQAATLGSFYAEALALIPDGAPKTAGQSVGLAAARNIINLRTGDGRLTIPGLHPGHARGNGRVRPVAHCREGTKSSATCCERRMCPVSPQSITRCAMLIPAPAMLVRPLTSVTSLTGPL